MRALLVTVALSALAGCGPSERELCWQAAEVATQERIERECPGLFDTCPAASDIIADLQVAQEACP